jgi:hypothetical protein
MKLLNYTRLDSQQLRGIIRAVRPPGISNFDISFKNGQAHRGRAYTQGTSYHATASPLVIVALNRKERYPCHMGGHGKGYLPITTYTLQEAAVVITAHELRHLWQSKVKRGRRVWGARGRFSERDADAYALQMLRRFRRGELVTEVPERRETTYTMICPDCDHCWDAEVGSRDECLVCGNGDGLVIRKGS